MSFARVSVVTGANKGIGFAIVRNLALQYPTSKFNNGPLLIYLTARNKDRGLAAIEQIASDPQLKAARALAEHGGLTSVRYQPLDVSEEKSIDQLEAYIKRNHADGIDILINNAGIALDGFNIETARQTLQCNYFGTLSMVQHFLPHIRPGGRVVNVSSMVGKLNKYSPNLVTAFRAAAAAESTQATTELMNQYLNSISNNTYAQDGWPVSSYAVSKAGVTSMTMCIGRNERRSEATRRININACCPGFVTTDMTKSRGRKNVDEGAQMPVKLALEDIGDITGEFWEHGEVSRW